MAEERLIIRYAGVPSATATAAAIYADMFYPHTCHVCGQTFNSRMIGSIEFDRHVESHSFYDLESLFEAQESVGGYDCGFNLADLDY